MTALLLLAWWRLDEFRHEAIYWAALWATVWLDITILKGAL